MKAISLYELIGPGDLRVREAKVIELRTSLAESGLTIALFLVYPDPELMDGTATVTMGSVFSLLCLSHSTFQIPLYIYLICVCI